MQSNAHDTPSVARRAISGVVLLVVGIAITVVSAGYPIGRLTQMGPGFFPLAIGIMICALSVIIIITEILDTAPRLMPVMQWRGMIFVSAGISIFAVTVDRVGLIPSMFLAVFVSMLADRHISLLGILLYSVIATLAGWGLFLGILELPIPAFWRQ